MKYCPNCGKKIKNNVVFCPYCGTKQSNITFDPKDFNKNISASKVSRTKLVITVIVIILIVLCGGSAYIHHNNVQNKQAQVEKEARQNNINEQRKQQEKQREQEKEDKISDVFSIIDNSSWGHASKQRNGYVGDDNDFNNSFLGHQVGNNYVVSVMPIKTGPIQGNIMSGTSIPIHFYNKESKAKIYAQKGWDYMYPQLKKRHLTTVNGKPLKVIFGFNKRTGKRDSQNRLYYMCYALTNGTKLYTSKYTGRCIERGLESPEITD